MGKKDDDKKDDAKEREDWIKEYNSKSNLPYEEPKDDKKEG